eukprot:CAMPEP_0182577584 /NCGR_PEP_ID=MMETSP1324-20130603/38241_1 /TAXON_ID=236786 /ORGANISM="Florenciella sp., Strain RCC1587" /LENGTH=39 /DNA_ID= /DNA_START= /DNA_END= /DNA_ORIENTATION=
MQVPGAIGMAVRVVTFGSGLEQGPGRHHRCTMKAASGDV